MEIKINLEKDTDFRNEVRGLIEENVLSLLRYEKYEIVEKVLTEKIDNYLTNKYIESMADRIMDKFIARYNILNSIEKYINLRLDKLVLQEFNKRFGQ